MTAVHPYLNFNGNTEEVFNFYKTVFGGDFAMVMRYKDAPAEYSMGETNGEKIMHISLPLGDGTMLMASDAPGSQPVTEGNNIQLSLSAKSREEADRLFNDLSAGGKVVMPMSNTFWGAYFGMFADKFGINWMISFDENYQE